MRTEPILGVKVPEEWEPAASDALAKKTYHFELITPMIGGNTSSWVLDEKNPVRTQSVKGQLRFWWRTMQSDTEANALLMRENQIWGGKISDGSRLKSKVSIKVENQNSIQVSNADVVPRYISWPMYQGENAPVEPKAITKLKFDLAISYPTEIEEDVTNTMKLWCLFGGVGARTRRGTGSLYCEKLMSGFESVEDVAELLRKFGNTVKPHSFDYPILNGAIIAADQGSHGNPTEIWCGFLGTYESYRQGPGNGRNKTGSNPKAPGRSFWPEADSYRQILNQNDPRHKPEHPDKKWFPRAAFGLPIITKFKDRQDPGGGQQLELSPLNKKRWPAPLFLKVLQLQNGSVFRIALVLNNRVPRNLNIKCGHQNVQVPEEASPLQVVGKIMKKNQPLKAGENPYTHLISYIGLKEVQ